MARFLCKLVTFAALQCAILGTLALLEPGEPNLQRLTSVRHEIAETAPGPRLIINGDSNTLTAFDSKRIRRRTGLYPVNMGLGGGLALEFILNETQHVARPGDSVVLSLEYEHFVDANKCLDIRRHAYTAVVARRPQNLRFVPWWDVPAVLDQLLPEFHFMVRDARRRSMSSQRLVPAAERINQHGDLLPHGNATPSFRPPDFATVPRLDNTDEGLARTIERLNRFVRDCRQKHVAAYLVYGPYEEHYYAHNQGFIERVHRALCAQFEGHLLGRPADAMWPNAMFFDTQHHLNSDATAMHTERFVHLFDAARQTEVVRSASAGSAGGSGSLEVAR